MKQQKKQTKKEQMERDEAIKEKLRESQKMLSVLDAFAKDEVRDDFLHEKNGAAPKLTEKELGLLDEFSGMVQSLELGAKLDAYAADSAEHLLFLIEAKNKIIPSLEISYVDLRKLFDRILGSPYWNKETQVESVAPGVEEHLQQQQQQHLVASIQGDSAMCANTITQSNLIEPLSNLNVGLEKTAENLIHHSGKSAFYIFFNKTRVLQIVESSSFFEHESIKAIFGTPLKTSMFRESFEAEYLVSSVASKFTLPKKALVT